VKSEHTLRQLGNSRTSVDPTQSDCAPLRVHLQEYTSKKKISASQTRATNKSAYLHHLVGGLAQYFLDVLLEISDASLAGLVERVRSAESER
jgi:hypothetical protein